ncbi:MAG TPA: YaeQ family protein [Rhodocyclaceae bacterium]
MALKSTVFKANLEIADIDRGYYATHNLTLARHPSETDERMMMRLLAFALYADERLEFGKGLSTTDEPALWLKKLDGSIELWIEVGLPDERIVRRAAGRAERVVVLAYGGRTVDLWWAKEGNTLSRLGNLTVLAIDPEQSAALADLVERGMQLNVTLHEGQVMFGNGADTATIEPRPLHGKP